MYLNTPIASPSKLKPYLTSEGSSLRVNTKSSIFPLDLTVFIRSKVYFSFIRSILNVTKFIKILIILSFIIATSLIWLSTSEFVNRICSRTFKKEQNHSYPLSPKIKVCILSLDLSRFFGLYSIDKCNGLLSRQSNAKWIIIVSLRVRGLTSIKKVLSGF